MLFAYLEELVQMLFDYLEELVQMLFDYLEELVQMLGGRLGLSLEAGLLTSPSGGDTSPYFTSIQLSLWTWPLSRLMCLTKMFLGM